MKTILFDMDGTLTKPRKVISRQMCNMLIQLSHKAKVAIVTGSGIDYIEEQCSNLWNGLSHVNMNNFTLMPCNGTQLYHIENGEFSEVSTVSMKEEISESTYQLLVRTILRLQSIAADDLELLGQLQLSGNFISYRGSLLNWCPIGRSATDADRSRFIAYDTHTQIRVHLVSLLNAHLSSSPFPVKCLDLALGGSTSIDIYPTGWDKTYALNHVNASECIFVGDRCKGHGNDRQIYERIKEVGLGAYQVTDPAMTIKIIKENILPNLGE